MKWRNSSFWILALVLPWLLAPSARAQLVVSDPVLTQVTTEVLGQTYQLNQSAARANGTLETLLRYEGDPRAAARGMERLGSFVTNVGRMGRPRYRAEGWAGERTTAQRMQDSHNPYRQEEGESFQVGGHSVARDAARYAERLEEEAIWEGVREQREVNRQHQHTLLGRLSTVNQRLERADTHQELVAAQLEMDRLRALMEGARLLTENLQQDAEARTLLRHLAQEDERARRLEEQWAEARRRRTDRATQHRTWREEQAQALRSARQVVAPRF